MNINLTAVPRTILLIIIGIIETDTFKAGTIFIKYTLGSLACYNIKYCKSKMN